MGKPEKKGWDDPRPEVLGIEPSPISHRTDNRPRLVDFRNDRFEPYSAEQMAPGRVYLDGADITNEYVFYASETDGEVRSYALKDGRPFLNDRKEIEVAPPRRGSVVILLPGEVDG